jgi:tetratricopeptide (TPR) repeat protein
MNSNNIMTKVLATLFSFFLLTSAHAQLAKELYEQGLKMAQEEKAEEAIKLFDQSISLKSDEYVTWYNRGVAKSMLNLHEEAFKDFDQSIKLKPDYTKAYLNRGAARKRLTDYEGAMLDYNLALALDSNFADGYYSRGQLYNLLGQRIPACLDFERAIKLGSIKAQPKMQSCKDKPTTDTSWHFIMRLTRTAETDSYGFSESDPILAGTGPDGGPVNELAYFALLRDSMGKAIKFKKIGTCCSYKSAHGLIGGLAMLDKFEITYLVAEGVEKKSIVYLSMFDYQEPVILHGFKTVHPPK